MVQFTFEATVIHWRGPSPFFFAPLPMNHAEEIRRLSKLVSYGWGVIPVDATIGSVSFYTSLFPKDETYLLPLKDAVRKKTGITAGDLIFVEMTPRPPRR
ncbi:DUF1905 domain-containing protein [Neorhizobium galegae]|uniref:DUF1905 domain-containing protein n=1 Tax=Neorhizobium galegae bv. officinalis TaxID=323656 RepID=A0A0T7GH42_NEOGA|nr:DUF1905 domain-containing protein [Neorhizobium galegae]CDZ46589.1 Hypothetical protein NGAL_HAMBI1189_14690 [Neorhizobium galegae bv. officinalis]